MFIIIIHHGQKTFQVSIIRYINSIIYVQYKMDNICPNIWAWLQAYNNDIVYKARLLLNLLDKLQALFKIFLAYNIF